MEPISSRKVFVSYDREDNSVILVILPVLRAYIFSKVSRYTSNLPWSINSLSEEYRAHFLDQRNAMLEAGEADHVIRRKLFQYWFMAVIWTPIVSKLQSLIPPAHISS